MTLTRVRKELIWSQAQLARQAGIAAATVSKAERGESISSQSALRICRALTTALNREITPESLGLKVYEYD